MKAVILAGGFGTRLAEYTETIPKPMVAIGGKPILIHIMEHFAKFGVKDFVIAAGYKSEQIKKYFLDYPLINSNFIVNLSNGKIETLGQNKKIDWNVSVVDTGLDSMTGGRLLRLKDLLTSSPFFLTYGDGLSDVDLTSLVDTHNRNKVLATVTAVRPAARFGELNLSDERVTSFQEKPQLQQGWVNGGYFVIEPEFLEYLEDDSTVLEKEPLEKLAKNELLAAHRHEGFWQCMDTKRDRDYLQGLWESGLAPWV